MCRRQFPLLLLSRRVLVAASDLTEDNMVGEEGAIQVKGAGKQVLRRNSPNPVGPAGTSQVPLRLTSTSPPPTGWNHTGSWTTGRMMVLAMSHTCPTSTTKRSGTGSCATRRRDRGVSKVQKGVSMSFNRILHWFLFLMPLKVVSCLLDGGTFEESLLWL